MTILGNLQMGVTEKSCYSLSNFFLSQIRIQNVILF
nr:MAG TPA: hypothetical protein [Crassvirales sp.]